MRAERMAVITEIEDLRRLAEEGYREVVLSGINLCCYGRDVGSSLAEIPETVTVGGTTYTVTGIASNAFAGAGGSVDSVSIPKSVTSIRKDAFTAFSDLKNVYMTGYSSLDDLTVEDVRQALKTEVVVVDEPGADLVNCLIEAPDHKKIRRRQIYEQTGSSDSGQA